jgi:hypothetical protein
VPKALVIKVHQHHVWFNNNSLILNFDKTHYLQFTTKNESVIDINIDCNIKHIVNTSSTLFLGITIDTALSWPDHTDKLMVTLSKSLLAIRTAKPYITQDTLRMIYFSYFHTIVSYGIIFWGSSSNGVNTSRHQIKVIRIMTNSRNKDSSRELFKK